MGTISKKSSPRGQRPLDFYLSQKFSSPLPPPTNFKTFKVRFLPSESLSRRTAICLELSDRTAIRDIVRHWRHVERWKKRLFEWQGPAPGEVKSYLRRLHDKGMGYGAIQKKVNQWIHGHIREIRRMCEDESKLGGMQGETMNSVFKKHYPLEQDEVVKFLKDIAPTAYGKARHPAEQIVATLFEQSHPKYDDPVTLAQIKEAISPRNKRKRNRPSAK